jgi:hypothetical protein
MQIIASEEFKNFALASAISTGFKLFRGESWRASQIHNTSEESIILKPLGDDSFRSDSLIQPPIKFYIPLPVLKNKVL